MKQKNIKQIKKDWLENAKKENEEYLKNYASFKNISFEDAVNEFEKMIFENIDFSECLDFSEFMNSISDEITNLNRYLSLDLDLLNFNTKKAYFSFCVAFGGPTVYLPIIYDYELKTVSFDSARINDKIRWFKSATNQTKTIKDFINIFDFILLDSGYLSDILNSELKFMLNNFNSQF